MEKEKKLPVRPIGLGAAVAMGLYLALLALIAYLTVSGRVGEAQTERAVWLCFALASFVGVWTAAVSGGRGAASMLAGAVLWAAVVLLGVLVGGEASMSRALSLSAAAAVGTMPAALLTRGKKGKRGKRRKAANGRR